MATTVYKSTDASAPVLSGTAGALVALLDACLVSGYGSKTAAGWSKPYTGTNAAVFRQAASGSLPQHYLQVNDNAPGVGAAREARIVGYETMSAYSSGSGPFPTAAQLTNGAVVRKSTSADATARPWVLAADARTFYLFVNTGDAAATYSGYMFGDMYSYVTGDQWRCMIIGESAENSAAPAAQNFATLSSTAATTTGHHRVRNYTGTGGSFTVSKTGDGGKSSIASGRIGWFGLVPFPNGADGGLYLAPVVVIDGSYNLHGRLRGLYQAVHPVAAFADGDTFDGAGAYAGRSFLIVKLLYPTGGPAQGYAVLETTSWDTSP